MAGCVEAMVMVSAGGGARREPRWSPTRRGSAMGLDREEEEEDWMGLQVRVRGRL